MNKTIGMIVVLVIGLILIFGGLYWLNRPTKSVQPSQRHPESTASSTNPKHPESTTSAAHTANHNQMKITINNRTLTAKMANNSSAEALLDWLDEGPQTLTLRDFEGMEKVGGLHKRFPTNDEQTQTEAGDLILYQGNKFVLYYGPNNWNFTRLGKLEGISASSLKELLGRGKVTVTLARD